MSPAKFEIDRDTLGGSLKEDTRLGRIRFFDAPF